MDTGGAVGASRKVILLFDWHYDTEFASQAAEFSVMVVQALYKFILIVNVAHLAHHEHMKKQMNLLRRQLLVLDLRYMANSI